VILSLDHRYAIDADGLTRPLRAVTVALLIDALASAVLGSRAMVPPASAPPQHMEYIVALPLVPLPRSLRAFCDALERNFGINVRLVRAVTGGKRRSGGAGVGPLAPSDFTFTRAVNEAAAMARGRYLLLLQPWVRLGPGAMRALHDTFTTHPAVGVVGPVIMRPLGATVALADAGGLVFDDGGAWQYGAGQAPSSETTRYVRDTDYVSSLCMMVRTVSRRSAARRGAV